ncbi:PatB family C-S lyase [Viridibacterium curvum]|uniref:cysteine-S-conjugate beta-lyase n=1 Tax=Viridibacterium curvum TaxID=1101404 RepID=A0ABP9QWJ4_9RHOO
MPTYDFDTPPDRGRFHSMKWDRVAGTDVLPMWVADMDFAAPAEVLAALREHIDHGVLGYALPWPGLLDAIVEGLARDHGWRIDPDWIVLLPGVVTGFNLACALAGEPDDEVLTLTPVYPPMLTAPRNTKRRLVRSDLVHDGARWVCDMDDLRARTTSRTRMLMLCSPHNPLGRSFSRDELAALAAHAEAHDLLICSDEIHCGLVLDESRPHIPVASLSEAIARRTITLMAPSKTWNIAGLSSAFAVVSDAKLRASLKRTADGIVPHTNSLGLVATEAAYRHGHTWRRALLDYLRGNAERIQQTVSNIAGITTTPVEATYLAWLDCRALQFDNPVRHFAEHGVLMSDGRDFGAAGFLRLNFGCSRSMLDEALQRISAAASKPESH